MKFLAAPVTMVRYKSKYAAFAVDPSGQTALQTEADGPWVPLPYDTASRRWPSRLRLRLVHGTAVAFGICYDDEADINSVGKSLPGSGGSGGLGDDPISAIIGVFMLIVYLIMLPRAIVRFWQRCRTAKALRRQLSASRSQMSV